MRRRQAPGPATVGSSCVYVLRRPDGFFYAGSTEALYDRIRAHRQVSSTAVQAAGVVGWKQQASLLCHGPPSLCCSAPVFVHVLTWLALLL